MRSPILHTTVDLSTSGTADVAFAGLCERPLLRVSAPTTGTNPDTEYTVRHWYDDAYGDPHRHAIGTLAAGGTLEFRVTMYYQRSHRLELRDVATNCTVGAANPTAPFNVDWGEVRDVSFPVTCGP